MTKYHGNVIQIFTKNSNDRAMDSLRSFGLSPNHQGNQIQCQTEGQRTVQRQECQLVGQPSIQLAGQSSTRWDLPQAEVIPLTDTQDVKQKIMSVWNSVKYGKSLFLLDSKVQLASGGEPVWLLGKRYHRKHPVAQDERSLAEDTQTVADFSLDFRSRLWFTYRREFEQFKDTQINSDCGWGCMIRAGQMLLSNALLLQHLGRNWRWTDTSWRTPSNNLHRSIVRLFGDTPNTDVSPFSIHNMISIANETLDKKAGDWFGPASTAYLLKEALDRIPPGKDLTDNLCIYVAKDCSAVYEQDVRNLCKKRKNKVVRKKSEEPITEDFSIIDHISEYPNLLIVDNENEQKGKLSSGVIEGVPYFEEAKEMFESINEEEDDDDFHLLTDETQFYSLNEDIFLDGEPWVTEGQASASPRAPSSSRSQRKTEPKKISEWTPVLILIPMRLGTDKFHPVFISCLKSMLAMDNCVGIIGGRPRNALYFVGFQGNNLIHLDPHLVQDHVNPLLHNFNVQSYHCKSPKKMNISRLEPSCCVGFFCPTEQSFADWCEIGRDVLPSRSNGLPMFHILPGSCPTIDDCRSPFPEWEGWKIDCANEEISEDFVFL